MISWLLHRATRSVTRTGGHRSRAVAAFFVAPLCLCCAPLLFFVTPETHHSDAANLATRVSFCVVFVLLSGFSLLMGFAHLAAQQLDEAGVDQQVDAGHR